MKKTIRYEISVGVFVLAAAVILGYISLTISRMRVREGIDVRFRFEDACGLVKDSAVSVAGVEVGYVRELALDPGGALITARIAKSAGLRKNVTATIRSKSLLGEKYLELRPAGSDAPLLIDGDLVEETVTPVQIDQIIAWTGRMLEAVDPDEAARLIRSLSRDPDAARRIIKNMDKLLEELAALDEKKLKEFTDKIRIRVRLF